MIKQLVSPALRGKPAAAAPANGGGRLMTVRVLPAMGHDW
jgi:hypothetical protein